MNNPENIIYGFAIIGIVGAVIAFIKTPKEQRFWFSKYNKEEGVDYAPEYTKKERIIFLLKSFAWAIPLLLIAEFWFFDWLSEYSENANCYNYGDINGVHLVFYGLFVLMPLSFAIILFLIEGRRSIKIIKLGQNPLPDEKVFKPTKYKYGIRAKVQPIGAFSIMLFFIGLAVWGSFQAHDLTRDIKPCSVNNTFDMEAHNHAHIR